jgi:hypothetical protein
MDQRPREVVSRVAPGRTEQDRRYYGGYYMRWSRK